MKLTVPYSFKVRYKLVKIRRSGMSYRMRLAATLAADNRPGQVWEVRIVVV